MIDNTKIINGLIEQGKTQNKVITNQLDKMVDTRSRLATVEHDAKITRYISISFAGLFMAFLVSVGLTA